MAGDGRRPAECCESKRERYGGVKLGGITGFAHGMKFLRLLHHRQLSP